MTPEAVLAVILGAIVLIVMVLHWLTHDYQIQRGQLWPDGQPERQPESDVRDRLVFDAMTRLRRSSVVSIEDGRRRRELLAATTRGTRGDAA